MSKTRALFKIFFTARIALIVLGIGIGLLAMSRVAVAQQDKVDDDVEDVSDYCDEGYDCELESYTAIYDTSSTLQLNVESDTSVNLDALDDGYDSYDCTEVTSDDGDIADGCTIDNDGEGDADLPASFSLNSQTSDSYAIDTYSYLADIWDDPDACDDGDSEFCFEIAETGVDVTIGPVQINSVSPSSVTVGSSGSITINGVDLVNPFGGPQPTVGATLSGSNTGLTFNGINFNDQGTQGTVGYQVASNAEVGAWSLGVSYSIGDPTVINNGNFGNFAVVSASATVTGISPSTWNAGQSYTGVQITGTNFGSAPSVSLSDHTITVSAPYNTSTSNGNSTTYVNLSVPPTTPSEPVTVTVAPASGASPGSNTATVVGAVGVGQNSCPAALDSHSGFAGIVSTGTASGSGTMTASFSGGAFSGNSVTVPYGRYSTPESIASHIAALITKNYYTSGLSAQAIGSYILYKSTAVLGTPSLTASGLSFTKDASTACPPANLRYILAVENDTVEWQPVENSSQRGRQVTYVIKNWPTAAQTTYRTLTNPSYTYADITEHLTANGFTSSNYTADGVFRKAGQFGDVLGTGSLTNAITGVFITDRWFTLVLDGQPISGSIMTFDKAGKHPMDHIEIHLPTGPSFLNNYKNSDGTPKDVSLD